MDIDALLDQVKTRYGYRSDRQLSRALHLNDTSVYFYRSGKANPSPETMRRLAEMAQLDAQAVVMELLTATAKEPGLRLLYASIARKLSAAVLLIFAVLITPADAGQTANKSASAQPELYIMRYRRRLTRWLNVVDQLRWRWSVA